MDLNRLETHSDRRGTLVEAFMLPHDGQIFYVIAKPHETRGNHYHLRKTEKFLVVYGSAVMTVKNRDTNDVMKVEATGQKPLVMTISPNHTHAITATDEGAVFMVWADEQLNQNDPDTYMEEI